MILAADGRVVIVGAGQAGAWVARTLRDEGFTGEVTLIGAEAYHPYERPPLSKDVLKGADAATTGALLTAGQAQALGITCLLSQTVTAIDRAMRQVTCVSGQTLPYDVLFLTTGSRPRPLPWPEGEGAERLHGLRTRDDALRLRSALDGAQSLAVIGGGLIGLEVAATARQSGLEVTVIEAGPRLCARSLPPVASDWLADLHRQNGVSLRMGETVAGVQSDGLGVTLTLGDGATLRVDQVLVGIGILPETGLAQSAGLTLNDGIVVDAEGRTSDPAIFAAGDATRQPCPMGAAPLRQETWANAQAQGIGAARAALGLAPTRVKLPWFWSDQYAANIQVLGRPDLAATCIEQTAPTADTASWRMLDAAGTLVGAVAVNAPRALRDVRKEMEKARAAKQA
ncbi:NAD(P)/FAD-dependent oxidoreductase [Antarcticimicrobium sediminis]|uniref:NAD(P)/FAD-dependent oxidoreductase n=1 Tax=Antarcticimicrobium sediminis TaxID=2546227 RepID=UPI00140434D0|nr:FAD-dependent oxidoreductase [Antarcticimicrobium sediminis]